MTIVSTATIGPAETGALRDRVRGRRLITYDDRQVAAAPDLGFAVEPPGTDRPGG